MKSFTDAFIACKKRGGVRCSARAVRAARDDIKAAMEFMPISEIHDNLSEELETLGVSGLCGKRSFYELIDRNVKNTITEFKGVPEKKVIKGQRELHKKDIEKSELPSFLLEKVPLAYRKVACKSVLKGLTKEELEEQLKHGLRKTEKYLDAWNNWNNVALPQYRPTIIK